MPEGVSLPASTEPAPSEPVSSPFPPPLPSSLQDGPGLQLQRPPEPSPGRILLKYSPGLTTSLLKAFMTPHWQDKAHTLHMNPPISPLPPRPNPNSTALHSRPFTLWWSEVDPCLRTEKTEGTEVRGRPAHLLTLTWAPGGAETKHLQPMSLQEHLFQQVNSVSLSLNKTDRHHGTKLLKSKLWDKNNISNASANGTTVCVARRRFI